MDFKDYLNEAEAKEVVVPIIETTEKPNEDTTEQAKEEVVEAAIITLPTPVKPVRKPKLTEQVSKHDKALLESIKQSTATHKMVANQMAAIVESITALADITTKLSNRIDEMSDISIPAPVVHVTPMQTVSREVLRDSSGKITKIVDTPEHNEDI